MSELNNSVIKAMKILELFKDNELLTIATISDKTSYSKSAINRILTSFESLGYLTKNMEQYRLSNKLYYLGMSTNVINNLVEMAKPYIEKLANNVKLTVSLSIMEDYKAVIIYQRQSNKIMNVTPPLGNKSGLNCTASGKVLVAFSKDPEGIIEVMDFDQRTPNTIMSKKDFRQVIKQAQKNGYAYEDEEIELGLYCLAVPIVDNNGHIICSISVSGYRKYVLENDEETKAELLKCAKEISEAITQYN